MEKFWKSSVFAGGNAAYLEEMFELYLEGEQIPANWRDFFANLTNAEDVSHAEVKAFIKHAFNNKNTAPNSLGLASAVASSLDEKAWHLIDAYKELGHIQAELDPLGLAKIDQVPALDPSFHGLKQTDQVANFGFLTEAKSSVASLVAELHKVYANKVGLEYLYVEDKVEKAWIEQTWHALANLKVSEEQQLNILHNLTKAEGLEKFLSAKYPGAKRFSLEGGDSLSVVLEAVLQEAAKTSIDEIVLGMPHRGRLNVLINFMGQSPAKLFDKFENKITNELLAGDVKYHMGFSQNVKVNGRELHLSLAFNPSHLEMVTPVITGMAKASQGFNKILPIIMHGDAAFSGQGVVMESLSMSRTRGYGVNGSVHIVVNNQVGFTTNKEFDTRSSRYSTDIAKLISAPVIHVNADSPEDVLRASLFALRYREKFQKDVVLDLVCYRRNGHNEADEPSVTQPLMYQVIRKRPTVRKLYADELMQRQVITEDKVKALQDTYRKQLENKEIVNSYVVKADDTIAAKTNTIAKLWQKHNKLIAGELGARANKVITKVAKAQLQSLGQQILASLNNITMHSRVAKIYQDRAEMFNGNLELDWGAAETLAYASLLNEGYSVRLSGQDCGRGTFFHRQAVVHAQDSGAEVIPLSSINAGNSTFSLIDSLLSEEAVLAFEYGYALNRPDTLVIWEAQFGDFANGAQAVIDQMICASEQKWGLFCGLTMLLPHAYEGQGPEHSSARLERYLSLCAKDNMQVCYPTTAKQIFHLLRRQMKQEFRKPLIVMSPKSLLRHKLATCTMQELEHGEFTKVIADEVKAKKVILCSGKVYVDLHEYRAKNNLTDVAILRIEQLYPWPAEEIKQALQTYKVQEIVWCQEEPKNQGAWLFAQDRLRALNLEVKYAGREECSSTATGYPVQHAKEQAELVARAFS